VLKRRLTYLHNRLSRSTEAAAGSAQTAAPSASEALVAGQVVRVRSRAEIRATLDDWNCLRGCGFMEEMWPYCDTTQTVAKRVQRFIDERDHQLKRARGIVFLKGLHCQGTVDYGRCDRNCLFFWREEWLEAIE
jgi:hypothetical protein